MKWLFFFAFIAQISLFFLSVVAKTSILVQTFMIIVMFLTHLQ
jgi:hypothetical protein